MESFLVLFLFLFFSVSLGDLAELKGFRYQQEDTGLNPDGWCLTPEKANGQYRETKLSGTFRNTHTHTAGGEREKNQR